ncbi:hypothetical protein BDW22DRAFT_1320933, partial [Trametopsis cervina]
QVDRDAAASGKNTARDRWRRAIFLTLRLQDGNTMLADERVQHADASRKYLETQHWLEMIDVKHRYGANCLNYLVQIDSEGKLRWARTGEVVDTTPGSWKDSGTGKGVVPVHLPEDPTLQHRTSFVMPAHSMGRTGSDSSLSNNGETGQMHYYLGPRPTGSRIKSWLWRNLTPRGLLERLLRRTIQKNTWIYVSVSQTSLQVHSRMCLFEFLLLILDSTQHFRYFLGVLEERGVDMHKVEISKAEAALWGYVQISVCALLPSHGLPF